MQSDETIPWQIHPKQQCQSCGEMADHSTLGHMYRVHCSSCDKEEFGMFSPPIDPDLPPARPFEVYLDCSAVNASAHNMFMLSKLHKSLRYLKPIELKALISSGQPHFIGRLPLWELEELQKATANSAFLLMAHEEGCAPHAQLGCGSRYRRRQHSSR
ncbi:MAG TPA: hypothetical protein VF800_15790 [Telluria sp.]|jgi:ribosomal protein S27AE